MPPADDTGLAHLLERQSDDSIRRHFLAPLAYLSGIKRFRKDYAASVLLAEYREQTLAEALAALAGANIPTILLKGASYIGALYTDPGERPMSDLDLMVPRDRREDAARALRRLGYWDAGPSVSSGRNYHAITYKRRNASVDLHWTIVQPWRSRIDVDALWRRARPASGRPEAVLRLDPVDEAAVHLIHIARSELRVPLINYVDAQRLLSRVESRDAIGRAATFRLGRGARAAVAMTRALLEDRPFRWPLLPRPATVIEGTLPPRSRQLVHKLALLDGPREWLGLGAAYLHNRLSR